MKKYISIAGLNQSISHKINIQERLELYKYHKRYLANKAQIKPYKATSCKMDIDIIK